jgi:MOSC domain-containing protein YiiM
MKPGLSSGGLTVLSVNLSELKGTVKSPVDSITLDAGGVAEDAHHGTPGRQVSLLDRDLVEEMARSEGIGEIAMGAMGENITCRFQSGTPSVGDIIRIGEVSLRIARIGKECHGDGCAIFRSAGRCVMPSAGVFCEVLEGGTVTAGMTGSVGDA